MAQDPNKWALFKTLSCFKRNTSWFPWSLRIAYVFQVLAHGTIYKGLQLTVLLGRRKPERAVSKIELNYMSAMFWCRCPMGPITGNCFCLRWAYGKLGAILRPRLWKCLAPHNGQSKSGVLKTWKCLRNLSNLQSNLWNSNFGTLQVATNSSVIWNFCKHFVWTRQYLVVPFTRKCLNIFCAIGFLRLVGRFKKLDGSRPQQMSIVQNPFLFQAKYFLVSVKLTDCLRFSGFGSRNHIQGITAYSPLGAKETWKCRK